MAGVVLSHVTVGPFEENTYLLMDEATRAAVLIDPGDDDPRMLEMVRDARAALQAIWLTHAHIDHIGGIAAVKRAYGVPVHLHPFDREMYEHGAEIAHAWEVPFEQPPPFDREFAHGERLTLGSLQFDVMHLPGHSPGSVAFYGHGMLIDGDVLFAGSVGRTDLPMCDPSALEASLEQVATLPPETAVFPGHGPATTIGAELRSNPFLTGIARVVRR